MIVDITQDQVLQIAANAVNTSSPMGMGFLHAKEKEYTSSDVESAVGERGIDLDCFDGRMVKLYIPVVEGGYCFPDHEPRHDYQSWAGKYPSYQKLIESVVPGVEYK